MKKNNGLEAGLYNSLKRYGYIRILTSYDIWLAGLFALGITILVYSAKSFPETNNVCQAYLVLAVSMVGIIITGIAIISSFSEDRFFNVLARTEGFIDTFIFSFRYTAFLSVISIILSILYLLFFSKLSEHTSALSICFGLVTFFFLYALFSIMYLMSSLHELMLKRNEYFKNKPQDKSD